MDEPRDDAQCTSRRSSDGTNWAAFLCLWLFVRCGGIGSKAGIAGLQDVNGRGPIQRRRRERIFPGKGAVFAVGIRERTKTMRCEIECLFGRAMAVTTWLFDTQCSFMSIFVLATFDIQHKHKHKQNKMATPKRGFLAPRLEDTRA